MMFKYMEWDKYLGLRKLSFYDTLFLEAKAGKTKESVFFESFKNYFSRSVGGYTAWLEH